MDLNKIAIRFASISFSILIAVLVFVGLFKIGTYCYEFGYRVFTEAPVETEPGTDIEVQITSDMSGLDIGEMLKDRGLIRDGKLFAVQLKLSAYAKKIKPGFYTLNTSMTAKDMMIVMSAQEEDTEDTKE